MAVFSSLLKPCTVSTSFRMPFSPWTWLESSSGMLLVRAAMLSRRLVRNIASESKLSLIAVNCGLANERLMRSAGVVCVSVSDPSLIVLLLLTVSVPVTVEKSMTSTPSSVPCSVSLPKPVANT